LDFLDTLQVKIVRGPIGLDRRAKGAVCDLEALTNALIGTLAQFLESLEEQLRIEDTKFSRFRPHGESEGCKAKENRWLHE
jgi:hypothetical protein